MAEGFRRAGILFDASFDWDADSCASYEANLGHRPLQVDVRELVRMARLGFRPGAEIELLVADPPCTPWSRAGKRLGLEDERDLLAETCELIALWRPLAYLIGNVPGLQDAPNASVVDKLIGGLAAHGYCTRDYAILDAADVGVPQHRVRPFWFGHLDGPCMRWPEPTHCAPGEERQHRLPGLNALRPWVTCREALSHLPPEELGRPVRLRWKETDDHRPTSPDEPAKTITRNTHSDGALLVPERILGPFAKNGHPICEQDLPARTVTTRSESSSGGILALTWPWHQPSTAVMGDARLQPPGHNVASGRSSANAVVLSERAAKILQGFPESWTFVGKTKRSRWAQLGMAMPPPFAEAVARSIKGSR
jgi:site-specific DNA-cytosine methylase